MALLKSRIVEKGLSQVFDQISEKCAPPALSGGTREERASTQNPYGVADVLYVRFL